MKKSKIEKIEKIGVIIGLDLDVNKFLNCGNANKINNFMDHDYYCFYDNHPYHIPYIVLDYKKLSESEKLILTCTDQELAKLIISIIINQKSDLIIGANNLQTIKEFLL